MNTNDDKIEEAEIVDNNTPSNTSENTGQDQASVLINLEQMIKTHISTIDKTRVELKKHREMLEDVLINNPTYQEHAKKAKEANQVKAMTKGQIMKQPNVSVLSEKIKDMQSQVKELDAALSDYLREYQRLSGSNEIEGEDGEVREIVYVAKLIKKMKKFK
jgi:hypothetical protein